MVNGSSYETNDGDYNLDALFKKNIVDAGQIAASVFSANIAAYHTDDSFKSFVRAAYDDGGDNAAQLLLVAFGGPDAIKQLMKSARTHGIKGANKATARKGRGWQSKLIEAISNVGHRAMSDYFNDNKDELFEKCGVPTDSRRESFENMLMATGRGTLSHKVSSWDGVGKAGDKGSFAMALVYRLDGNIKGRAKRDKVEAK